MQSMGKRIIEILPMEDREQEKELLAAVETAGAEARVLAMKDRGELLGYAAVELENNVLRILKLSAGEYDFTGKPQGETAFVLDTLTRSAASYGETFGAEEIVTAFPDFFGFFKARGFQTDETHAFTPMSTIVRYE